MALYHDEEPLTNELKQILYIFKNRMILNRYFSYKTKSHYNAKPSTYLLLYYEGKPHPSIYSHLLSV